MMGKDEQTPKTTEIEYVKFEGKGLYGGSYCGSMFYDENGNECDVEHAKFAVYMEFDENKKCIKTELSYLDPQF